MVKEIQNSLLSENDLKTLWEEYRNAAKRSTQLKRQLKNRRTAGLGLLISSALTGVLAGQSATWTIQELPGFLSYLPQVLGYFSAAALGLATYLFRDDAKEEQVWALARSQAEALKSEAYCFMVKAPPYDKEDRGKHLADKMEDILGDMAQSVSLTEEEKLAGLPESWLSMEEYLEKRVNQQIHGYYKPRSREVARTHTRLQRAGFWLGMLGVLLGAGSIGVSKTSYTAWIAVIGTITGALTAFIFSERYQYLKTSFELAARKLTRLSNDWSRLPKDEKPGRAGVFVHKFEDVISAENRSWIAELTEKSKKRK